MPGSPYYYIWFWHNGRRKRESSKSTSKEVAERLLSRRMAEAGLGIVRTEKGLRYEDVRATLLADYETNGRASLMTRKDGRKTVCGLGHLDTFFARRPVVNMGADTVRDFIRKRQAAGGSNTIINRSLALLRRMLKLAHTDNKLQVLPAIKLLPEADPREGFVTPEEFSRVLAALPANLRPLAEYLYFTGCRVGAARAVGWDQIVFDGELVEVRLRGKQTKNRKPLLLPLPADLAGHLRATRKDAGPVFNATNLVHAFRKACVAAGLGKWRDPKDRDAGYDGLTLHDLRRSGVRNLRRAGVAEDVAMKISGHRNRGVFARYNITDSTDLHDAMRRVQDFVRTSLAGNGTNLAQVPTAPKT